jgi:hypothetical protein
MDFKGLGNWIRVHTWPRPQRDEFRIAAERLEQRAAALGRRPSAKAIGNDQLILSISDLVRALGSANSATTIYTLAIFTFTAMGAILVFQQGWETRRATLTQNEFTLNAQFFGDPQNREIIADIEHGMPILVANGGRLSDVQLDMYLDTFETIDGALLDNQLRPSDLCDDFSHYVDITYADPEIGNYIAKQRKADPRYFVGLDDLHAATAASADPDCHEYAPSSRGLPRPAKPLPGRSEQK